MPAYEIKSISGSLLFSGEFCSLAECVEDAYLNGANLRRANLSGAALSGANLRGAALSEADLNGAALTGADLRLAALHGADLRGADLRRADLRRAALGGADLSGANLSGANLSGAYLIGADLSGAALCKADLIGADLSGAALCKADLRWAKLRGARGDFASEEESDETLAQIAEIVLARRELLEMDEWHGEEWDSDCSPEEACGTPHCLAGWAQALCPVPVIRRMEALSAGLMLIPTAAHMFYASNEEVLEFLKTKRRKCEPNTGTG